jgi:hypothetical protein
VFSGTTLLSSELTTIINLGVLMFFGIGKGFTIEISYFASVAGTNK